MPALAKSSAQAMPATENHMCLCYSTNKQSVHQLAAASFELFQHLKKSSTDSELAVWAQVLTKLQGMPLGEVCAKLGVPPAK